MRMIALALTTLIVGWTTTTFAADAAKPKNFSTEQTKDIEGIVKSYLLAHPEVIAEAIDALQKREEAATAEAAKQQIVAAKAELYQNADDLVLGNPNGDVTLVEFYDYRCGYCKHVIEPLNTVLKDDPKVRLVLKSWPVLGPDSLNAARAVYAAKAQGADKQISLHHALMDAKNPIDDAKVMSIAKDKGLDIERLRADMTDAKITTAIEKTKALATKLNVGGTPTFVLGDKMLPGVDTAENLKKAVAAVRKSS